MAKTTSSLNRPVTATQEQVQQAACEYAEAHYRRFVGNADMTINVSPYDPKSASWQADVFVGLVDLGESIPKKMPSGFLDFWPDGSLHFATTPQTFKTNLDEPLVGHSRPRARELCF